MDNSLLQNGAWMLMLVSSFGFLGMATCRNIYHEPGRYTEETVEVSLEDLHGRPVTTPFSAGSAFRYHPRYRRAAPARSGPGRAGDGVKGAGLRMALTSTTSSPLHLLIHDVIDILAPTARVEWFDGRSNATVSRPIRDGCLFQAEMENDTHYGGFLNLCDGISGVIETPQDELHILPLGDGERRRLNVRHILRRHSKRPNDADHRCGTDEVQDFRESVAGHSTSHSRHRRDVYRRGPKYIEVLLATDLTVEDFHGRTLMEQYLLTQLSIVNMAYQHESIGVDIKIVVNKIVLIPEDTAEDIVSEKTGKSTLDKFCRWINQQKQLRFPHEQSHDLAIYITRRDIGPAVFNWAGMTPSRVVVGSSLGGHASTYGYAPVTGMCNPARSCTVNKDDGISSAFVIAHEMGHVLGLQHDGVGNDCEDDPDDGKIMAALVQSSYEKYYWTTCAKNRLARYIDHYHCLDNEPVNPKPMDFVEPYGQSWSLDEQCRQEFGDDFQLCEAFAQLDPCEYLWCSDRESPMLCRTKRGPPLPGTKCAGEKWCMGGRCVWIDNSMVDGGWSEWGQWTDCSRTCGTGVMYRHRRCDDPYPQNGGDDCDGDAEEFDICNRFPCGGEPLDFRAQQCSWLNHLELINHRQHTWLPLENKNVSQLCRLTCISMETGDIIVTEENVIDGTPCSYEIANDICIKGKCQALGCDGVPNSVAREDMCGVCMGRHDRCGHETGLFDTRLVKDKYYKILTIPRGARDIFIQEMQSSSVHILAVKDPRTGYFYFNGDGRKGHSRQFIHQGTRFVYITRTIGETLAARGPLIGEVSVMVHSKSNKIPVQVAWRFIVPTELRGRKYMEEYQEDLARLNPTTPRPTTKPPPTTTTTTTTAPPRRNEVNEKKQDRGAENGSSGKEYDESRENRVEKPVSVVTDPPAPKKLYEWRFVDWTPCSRTCGEGEQQSDPICARSSSDYLVADEYCREVPNPGQEIRKCKETECRTVSPYRWVAEDWSVCTETCGRDGSQARRVHCMHNYFGQDYPVDPVYCTNDVRPDYYQRCNEIACPASWHRGPWLKCSVSCGAGRQERQVYCAKPDNYNTYKCEGPRPPTVRQCRMRKCPGPTTTTTTTTTPKPTTTTITTTTTLPPTTTTARLTTTTTLPTTKTTPTTTTPTTTPTTTTAPTTTTTTTPTTTTTTTPEPTTTTRQTTTTNKPTDLPTTRRTARPTIATHPATTPLPPSTTPSRVTEHSSTTKASSRASGARVEDNSAQTCTVDKSFFCKMAKARNCHLPLYSSFCCASCRSHGR